MDWQWNRNNHSKSLENYDLYKRRVRKEEEPYENIPRLEISNEDDGSDNENEISECDSDEKR